MSESDVIHDVSNFLGLSHMLAGVANQCYLSHRTKHSIAAMLYILRKPVVVSVDSD